jgi:phenylacetate-coenzyme A ligase PaaK-like adenylate-forming protein
MTQAPWWKFDSAVPGAAWPAIPAAGGAMVLSLLHQLERTQWLAPEKLLELQLGQLAVLLRHAHASVPHYASTWAGAYDAAAPLDYERFARLPLLKRRDLQDHFADLRSANPPAAHGAPEERRTSGSTGAPVRFLSTPLAALYWNAVTLRDHLWHGRDPGLKLAVIRRETEDGESANWGPATLGLMQTGRSVAHSIFGDVDAHLDWLLEQRPAYLYTYPSLVAELARLSMQRGVRPAGLREVRTLAESLDPGLRALVREAWNVPLTDLYSASETGYLALQCPQGEHYHVQSEDVLLEVLDDHGRPCGPGQVGRVVVTPLHNFAMPLVRYDIQDYAEIGAPCACGRGLPVLRRILGRVRNTLVTADGKKYWPVFGTRALMESAPVLQHQFVQKTHELVEARLVVAAPLTPGQEARFRERVLSQLPSGMRVQLSYVERIERSASGKFEDFVCELSAAPR